MATPDGVMTTLDNHIGVIYSTIFLVDSQPACEFNDLRIGAPFIARRTATGVAFLDWARNEVTVETT
jgi:hypothetical protein